MVGLIGQFWKFIGSRRRGMGALGLLLQLYCPDGIAESYVVREA